MSEIAPDVDNVDDTARRRGGRLLRGATRLLVLMAVAVAVSLIFDTSVGATILAVVFAYIILRAGWFFLQSFATPLPQPPEPGTMRRVKLTYRCSICGAEVRMTAAPSEEPEPPRHCMEDMDPVSPVD